MGKKECFQMFCPSWLKLQEIFYLDLAYLQKSQIFFKKNYYFCVKTCAEAFCANQK